MKKRILVVVFTIAMVFSLAAVSVMAAGETCTESSCDHVAAIGDTHYSDLHEAMVAANSGETVKLLKNVDLAATEWEPVTFKGKFDGQNYTIENLTISKSGVSNTGFITSLNSSFENVTFTNPTVTGGENTGVVAGRAGGSAALAKNITVNGTIKVETTHSGYARVAVIVGGWAYGNYENITVDGTDAAVSYVKHSGGGDGRYAAGIVGHADDVESYINCTVKNITISGGWLCGGIAGPGPSDGLASGCSVENVKIGASYSGGMFGWYYGVGGSIENCSVKDVEFTAGSTKNGAIGGYQIPSGVEVENVTIENVTNSSGSDLMSHAATVSNGTNTTYYATLEEALKALKENDTLTLLSDVTIDDEWDCRSTGAKIMVPVTIDGDGHTITLTGKVEDKNWDTVFRFEADAVVKNLTIDASEATGVQRGITAKFGIDMDKCTLIGNGTSAKRAVIFGEGAGASISDVVVSITNSTFKDWSLGVSDNQNAQDAKSVSITGNNFTNADVLVSAYEEIVFTGNTMDNSWVNISTYTKPDTLKITATGNTLEENTDTDENEISAPYNATVEADEGFDVKQWKVQFHQGDKVEGYEQPLGAGPSYVLEVASGESVTFPEIDETELKPRYPEEGYYFYRWLVNGTRVKPGKTYTYDELYDIFGYYMPEYGFVIKAEWSNKYDVTFNNLEGNWPEGVTEGNKSYKDADIFKVSVTYNKTLARYQIPETPVREGYTFTGWYTDEACTNKFDTEATSITAAMTLYAGWEANRYHITLALNGGELTTEGLNRVNTNKNGVHSFGVFYDKEYARVSWVEADMITREGYDFAGWYADEALTKQVKWNDIYKTVGDSTLYAKWEPARTRIYLELNGGTLAEDAVVNQAADGRYYFGAYVDKAYAYCSWVGEDKISKTGYTFDGWYKDSGLTEKVNPNEIYGKTGSTTIYAKWTPNTYANGIQLNANGGTVNGKAVENIEITYGETFTFPKAERKGHTFLYWEEVAADREVIERSRAAAAIYNAGDVIVYETEEGLTFKAVWDVNEYTVTYTDGVNNAVIFRDQTYTVAYGDETPAFDGNPGRRGYKFDGWTPDVSDTVTGDVVYTAKWVKEAKDTSVSLPNLYNVKVKVSEGGTTNVSDSFMIAYGASRTIKITPDEGYEVEDILVNGKSVMDKVTFKLDTAKYALKAANKNYVIEVKFAEIAD